MALGGIAPLLIFTYPENIAALSPVFNALSGIPLVGDLVSPLNGIPIPLYLSEELTGIYVDTESKNIDIETNPQVRYDNKAPTVYQRLIGSSVSVNILASKDSIILPAFLALIDLIVPRLVSQNYKLSYINGSTVILNGLLQGLNTSQGADDDLIRITLQIQKNDQRVLPANPAVLAKQLATIPTPGG